MGYNTTVVVMNDALHAIRDDPDFGRRLADAVQALAHGKPVNVSAHGGRAIHCNAATVIETHHADHTVYVGIGQNYGVPVTREQDEVLRKAAKRASRLIAKGRLAPVEPRSELKEKLG